mmetsp:Transcript_31293/g.64861  ORF Transcript_31293/g.64861 Transcript_31293/m.64861 type:complete len:98 (-) Transcript_31293:121-414(-)
MAGIGDVREREFVCLGMLNVGNANFGSRPTKQSASCSWHTPTAKIKTFKQFFPIIACLLMIQSRVESFKTTDAYFRTRQKNKKTCPPLAGLHHPAVQ